MHLISIWKAVTLGVELAPATGQAIPQWILFLGEKAGIRCMRPNELIGGHCMAMERLDCMFLWIREL